MKLLFAIKAMNNPGGGAERVLAVVCNGLARRGHEVSVLTFEAPGGQSFYPLSADVRRIDIGIGSTTDRAGWLETVRRMISLRRAVVAERPDIVIGFMISMFIPLGLALLGTRIPMIASEHIVPQYYRDKPLQRGLLRLLPSLAIRVLCVSEQVRASYASSLRARMEVMPNPIVMEKGSTRTVTRSGSSGRHVLLSVGRLVHQKDYPTLIEAFASLAPDFPEWRLRIVGDGGERGRLERLARRLGVADRVELPGSTTAIGEEYAAADLYVVPSRYESFGLATAEAIAHGLPAVGFADCPGTNELIRHGTNGALVSGEDRITALAGALRPLMRDSEARQRLSNPGTILARFGVEAILDRWEALLARCTRQRDTVSGHA